MKCLLKGVKAHFLNWTCFLLGLCRKRPTCRFQIIRLPDNWKITNEDKLTLFFQDEYFSVLGTIFHVFCWFFFLNLTPPPPSPTLSCWLLQGRVYGYSDRMKTMQSETGTKFRLNPISIAKSRITDIMHLESPTSCI